MGFSGGGSNVLLPHTHDGRVSQDGGPLNFSNITQSQSAAGEVFYSDGTALQQLAYPGVPAGETLTAAAASTAPAWVAAAAATSAFELVDDQELGGTATFIDSTFAAISGDDVSQLQIVLDLQRSNVVCDILLQYGIGGLVTSAYYTSYTGTSIASGFYNNQAQWLIAPDHNNYRHLMTNAFISLPTSSMTTFNADMLFFSNSANTNPEGYISGGTRDGTGVAGVDQLRVSVSAGVLEQGTKMSIYKLNR